MKCFLRYTAQTFAVIIIGIVLALVITLDERPASAPHEVPGLILRGLINLFT